MNETKIGVVQRMTLISGGNSIIRSFVDHENILKKVTVEGVPLSVIKKIQQDPNSIHLKKSAASSLANLSTPLLKGISVKVDKNVKKSLFELQRSFKT